MRISLKSVNMCQSFIVMIPAMIELDFVGYIQRGGRNG